MYWELFVWVITVFWWGLVSFSEVQQVYCLTYFREVVISLTFWALFSSRGEGRTPTLKVFIANVKPFCRFVIWSVYLLLFSFWWLMTDLISLLCMCKSAFACHYLIVCQHHFSSSWVVVDYIREFGRFVTLFPVSPLPSLRSLSHALSELMTKTSWSDCLIRVPIFAVLH